MMLGAQQSSDCEHASELSNAAWQHEAPRIVRFGDAQDTRGMGVFFWFVFFHVEENEHGNFKSLLILL